MNTLPSRRYATFLLALLASAQASSLRGGEQPQLGNDKGRRLYGTEYGLKGFQALFSDVGFGKSGSNSQQNNTSSSNTTASSNSTSSSASDGPAVLFTPSDAEMAGFQARIVGGSNSAYQDGYVMHLSYQSSDNSWHFAGCGGSLIGNCHVLTAAHCVTGDRAGLPNGVYVGAYQPFLGNSNYPFHFSSVSKVIVHPNFDSSDNANDVAIISMTSCVDLTQFQPMIVATPSFMASNVGTGTSVTAVGFGRLSSTDTTLVQTLQSVTVPFINSQNCNLYDYPGRIKADMVCAGLSTGGKDSCQGDSGGPLMVNPTSVSPVQIGIVSWGTGCAQAGHPGVYASTSFHYDFIQNVTCSDTRTATSSLSLCSGWTSTSWPTYANADNFNSPVGSFSQAAPVRPPTQAPVPAPAPQPSPVANSSPQTCSARGQPCASSLDCCGALFCFLRSGVCAVSTSTSNKNSLNSNRRYHGF